MKAKNRLATISWHLLFWIAIIALFTFLEGGLQDREALIKSFFNELSLLPVQLLAVYFTLFYLIPKKLASSKPLQFAAWLVGSLIIWSLIQRAFTYYVAARYFHPDYPNLGFWLAFRIAQAILVTIIPVLIMALAKIGSDWYKKQQQIKVLEKVNLETELALLKSQINPHFFFNTLNNLYGMALQKSEATPTMILKLSEIMSYVLYEANVQRIPLNKEISVMKSYIELESLRYGDQLKCSFQVSGNTNDFHLAPLLLLPLVENAFKHGIVDILEESWINIFIQVASNKMEFTVENSREANPIKLKNSGIGLNNVRRRLELLYPQIHQLKICEEVENFWIKLELYEKD